MNPELLIAEIVSKLHSGAIDPHGPNTEADVRGIVMKHWEAHKKAVVAVRKIGAIIGRHGGGGFINTCGLILICISFLLRLLSEK